MPEWNLVAERQRLFLTMTSISLIGAIVLSTGCSKLPGLQDYASTEYGSFESQNALQPPSKNQLETEQASQRAIEQAVIESSKVAQARNEAEQQLGIDAVTPVANAVASTMPAFNNAAPNNAVRNDAVRKIQAVQDAATRSSTMDEILDNGVRNTSFDSQVLEQLVTTFDPESDTTTGEPEPEIAMQVPEPAFDKDVTLVATVGDDLAPPLNPARTGEISFEGRPKAMLPESKPEFPQVKLVNQADTTQTDGGSFEINPVAPGPDADAFARINERIPEARVASQPLRPMLFDEKTRELNAQYEKTLREPVEQIKLERDVALEAKTQTQSGVLRPIENNWDWVDGSTADSVAVDANAFSASEEKINPVSAPSLRDEAPPFAEAPSMDTDNEAAFVNIPSRDQSAGFITGEVIHGEFKEVREVPAQIVPAEVFEDANRLAEASFHEIEPLANEFTVRTASNLDAAKSSPSDSSCEMCNGFAFPGSECPSCSEGKPLADNNEFSASDVPTVSDISPMVIPPSSVPGPPPSPNVPTDFESASGLPVPPKTPYNANAIDASPELVGVSPASLAVSEEVAPVAYASDIPPVGVDALMALNTVTWQTRLDQAIHLVEKQIDASSDAEAQSGLEINLRLLQVLRRQMGNVAQSETRLDDNEQQFWNHQLDAITSMLNSDSTNSDVSDLLRHQTAHETLDHLRQAVEQLESIANLKIAGGQLCTEISGFGQYKVFPSNELKSDQRMLVYCEVENYSSTKYDSATGTSFRTKLRGSFAVYDEWGKAVQQAEFPIVEDVARKRRRDFYMYLPVTLNKLEAGNYRLHVLVEDIYANKTATLATPIDFVIR